jgi:hypothetical protein
MQFFCKRNRNQAIVLAVLFGMTGIMKSSVPIAELSQKFPWASGGPAAFVRAEGIEKPKTSTKMKAEHSPLLWTFLGRKPGHAILRFDGRGAEGQANVVAGVENRKQELERTREQHEGKLGA